MSDEKRILGAAEDPQSHAAYLRQLFEHAADAVFVHGLDGRFIDVNRAASVMLGYSREELLTMHPWDYVTNGTKEEITDVWARMKKGEPFTVDRIFRRKDGSTVSANVRIVRFEAQGQDILIGAARDSTERNCIELDLRAQIRERERAEQILRGQTQALAKTLQNLSVEPALGTFLGQAVRVIAEQFESFCASIWFFDTSKDWLIPHIMCEAGVVLTSYEESQSLALRPLRVRELPQWAEFATTKRPLAWADVAHEPVVPPDLREYLRGKGVRSGLSVPLLIGEELIGALTIRSSEANRFQSEDIELAQALAHQVTLAVQLTRLGERSREAAVLDERNRLASEIHDTLAQSFAGLILQVEAAEEALAAGARDATTHLTRAKDAAKFGLSEARRAMLALRPVMLENSGLEKALQELAERSSIEGAISCEFAGTGIAQRLAPEIELGTYRIAQEAVSNAIRHAKATRVAIRLSFAPTIVAVIVEDDGQGIGDEQAALARQGYGLPAMRERAEKMGGSFRFKSSLGQGTRVFINVPIAVGTGGLAQT